MPTHFKTFSLPKSRTLKLKSISADPTKAASNKKATPRKLNPKPSHHNPEGKSKTKYVPSKNRAASTIRSTFTVFQMFPPQTLNPIAIAKIIAKKREINPANEDANMPMLPLNRSGFP